VLAFIESSSFEEIRPVYLDDIQKELLEAFRNA